MNVIDEFDYRNAKAILQSVAPNTLREIYDILSSDSNVLDLEPKGKQRELSKQIKRWFIDAGWAEEQPSFAASGMMYDLLKENIPVEIEIGHERLVFPDFFEFLADYSNGFIPAGVLIVTGTPQAFGHNWHCSLASTKRKIESIRSAYLVPTLVVAVDP